jgi:hypothetical protein
VCGSKVRVEVECATEFRYRLIGVPHIESYKAKRQIAHGSLSSSSAARAPRITARFKCGPNYVCES